MIRVIFLPRARAQLWAIHEYVARENPVAAKAIMLRVEEVSQFLADNPGAGFKLPHRRLRRFPVRPYPYLIYFERAKHAIRIVRIRHAARYRPAFHEQPHAFVR